MQTFTKKLERYLRLDRFTTTSNLMRARAVYAIGLAFIFTQFINLISMTHSYGGFTYDHMISLVVCAVVGGSIYGLRYSGNFRAYALLYSVLIFAGTFSSALGENTGINSALIPFFILGVIINGFLRGWRSTTVFGALSIVGIWVLWWVSTGYHYTPIFDVEKFADRNFQRAMQASLATSLITLAGAFFSKHMNDAFDKLEAGIVAAQASDRAKTDFLATMSHELCTPMNGIIGMNDVLQETQLDEDQRELTEVIAESGRDLQTIIGNVLLFSQLEGGRITLDDSAFDLREEVVAAVRPYAARAAEKNLKFKARMTPSVPKLIIGDKVRTLQIICALLDNAIKFTDYGAVELVVRGVTDDAGRPQLLIGVTDTGIGIAPEHKDRIFERFTQQDGSIKRRHGGTGLGLTIVRGLAELMGGEVILRSEINMGSSFGVRLDYQPAAAQAPAYAPALQEAAE